MYKYKNYNIKTKTNIWVPAHMWLLNMHVEIHSIAICELIQLLHHDQITPNTC